MGVVVGAEDLVHAPLEPDDHRLGLVQGLVADRGQVQLLDVAVARVGAALDQAARRPSPGCRSLERRPQRAEDEPVRD